MGWWESMGKGEGSGPAVAHNGVRGDNDVEGREARELTE